MNTPTHVLLSVAALSRRGQDDRPTYLGAAVLGAIVPDAPMYVFYAVEKLVVGSSEREIWTTRYFMPGWQDFFDLFNSAPIVALGALVTWWTRQRGWYVFFLSMLLHIACDLPLHHDDGHRHFWPLTDWRFESPVSYWDVNHFGRAAATAELVLFIGCYVWSMIKHRGLVTRTALTTLLVVHLALVSLMLWYLSGQ